MQKILFASLSLLFLFNNKLQSQNKHTSPDSIINLMVGSWNFVSNCGIGFTGKYGCTFTTDSTHPPTQYFIFEKVIGSPDSVAFKHYENDTLRSHGNAYVSYSNTVYGNYWNISSLPFFPVSKWDLMTFPITDTLIADEDCIHCYKNTLVKRKKLECITLKEIYNFPAGSRFQYKITEHKPAYIQTILENYEVTEKWWIADTLYYSRKGFAENKIFNVRGGDATLSYIEVINDTVVIIDSSTHYLNACDSALVYTDSRSGYYTYAKTNGYEIYLGDYDNLYTYDKNDSLVKLTSSTDPTMVEDIYRKYFKAGFGLMSGHTGNMMNFSTEVEFEGSIINGDTTGIISFCNVEANPENITICQGENYEGLNYPGTHYIKKTTSDYCDSIHQIVLTVNNTIPQVFIGKDTAIYFKDTLTLSANNVFSSYLWSNSTTTQSIQLIGRDQGVGVKKYWLKVKNQSGCTNTDTILISIKKQTDTVTVNQSICGGISYDEYTDNGIYYISKPNNLDKDTVNEIHLTINPKPYVFIGNDTAINTNENLTLSANTVFSSYLWNTSETTQGIQLNARNLGTGVKKYWLRVRNEFGCENTVTIMVTIYNEADTTIISRAICKGEGYQGFTNPGTYFIRKTNSGAKDSVIKIHLTVNPLPVVFIGNDKAMHTTQTFTLTSNGAFNSYLWNTGSTNNSLEIIGKNLGVVVKKYWLKVANQYGCVSTDTILVSIGNESDTAIVNKSICKGESFKGFTASGIHFIRTANNSAKDSVLEIHLTVNPLPRVLIGNDTSIAPNSVLQISADNTFSSYLWNTNDSTKSIQVSGNTLDSTGVNYFLKVKNQYGCVNSDTIYISLAKGNSINEVSTLSNIKIFPNPAADILYIQADDYSSANSETTVYDAFGKACFTRKITNKITEIYIGNLADGIYFIKTKNGIFTTQERIIKISE